MSASERLTQEKEILRQIRVALSTLETTRESINRYRKGVAYASTALTTGPQLYAVLKKLGFSSTQEFKEQDREKFNKLVMQPNMREGNQFAQRIIKAGWRMVIEPGKFFAYGWAQEHYMSLWRRVIIEMASTVAFNDNVYWSTGGAEELLIGIQHKKRLLGADLRPLDPHVAVGRIEKAIGEIDGLGYDATPLQRIVNELRLTLEAQGRAKKSA